MLTDNLSLNKDMNLDSLKDRMNRSMLDVLDDDDGITVKITNIATGEITYEYTFPYQEEAPDDDDD